MTSPEPLSLWVGPLGRLHELPVLPIRGSHPAGHDRIGAVHTSLSGTTTVDVLAHRRSWSVDWTCLTAAEWGYLEAWWLGLGRDKPYRIVDPRRANRLTRDGSSGGSYSHGVTAHTVTAGTRSYVPVTDWPADVELDGAVSWVVPAAGATLRIDDALRVPLIPGEQVTLAVLLADSGSAQVGAQLYDAAGVSAGTSLAAAGTFTGWAWRTHTFTPTAGQVAASLAVVAAAGARTVRVGPAQAEAGAASTPWTPGSGCPLVVLTEFASSYPLGLYDASIEIREV